MIGLLYKDFAGTKRETLSMLLVSCVLLLVSLLSGPSIFVVCIGAFTGLASVMPAASFQADRQSSWNCLICASPLPRQKVIAAKYISTLAADLLLIGMLFLMNLLGGWEYPWSLFAALAGLYMVLQSITIPVGLKWNQGVVAVIFALLVFGFTAGISALQKSGVLIPDCFEKLVEQIAADPVLPALLFTGAAALVFLLSCWVSCRIFAKMDF